MLRDRHHRDPILRPVRPRREGIFGRWDYDVGYYAVDDSDGVCAFCFEGWDE